MAQPIFRIAHNLYGYTQRHYPNLGMGTSSFIVELSDLLVFGSEAELRGFLEHRADEYSTGAHEPEIDLTDLNDTIMIGSLAFQNFCFVKACSHCCFAFQRNQASHSLEQFRAALPKMRFSKHRPVQMSLHDPFLLPFLLDAVELLLVQGAKVGLVSCGLGIPEHRRETIMHGLMVLHQRYKDALTLDLSFDLFRSTKDVKAHLKWIAHAFNCYPFVAGLKFNYSPDNRQASFNCLNELLREIADHNVRRILWQRVMKRVKETTLFPAGNAVNLLLQEQRRVVGIIDKLYDRTVPVEYLISPQARPYMLFPGGRIVPSLDFQSGHFATLGNILTDTVPEIYRSIGHFEALCCGHPFNEVKGPPYNVPYYRMVVTERENRRRLGIPADDLNTHFDDVARAMAVRGLLLRPEVAALVENWVNSGLASWLAIGNEGHRQYVEAPLLGEGAEPPLFDPGEYAFV